MLPDAEKKMHDYTGLMVGHILGMSIPQAQEIILAMRGMEYPETASTRDEFNRILSVPGWRSMLKNVPTDLLDVVSTYVY
jgi:hypothetical protein